MSNKLKESPSVNLVDISQTLPGILLDIRYATSDNFLGVAVYSKAVCYLHHDAALALDNVRKDVEKTGLFMKIYDGYRPLSVQKIMWDRIQDEKYVSNPAKQKSPHARGTAVDLTLVDKKGHELLMPTPFDDFTELAHSDSQNVPEEAKKNRNILKTLMEKHGFEQYRYEWWHFDLAGWKNDDKYPALDMTFEDLEKIASKGKNKI